MLEGVEAKGKRRRLATSAHRSPTSRSSSALRSRMDGGNTPRHAGLRRLTPWEGWLEEISQTVY